MQLPPTIPALRSAFDPALKLQPASLAHVDRTIEEPCILTEDDTPLVGYFPLADRAVLDLLDAVRSIPFGASSRTGGLASTSRIFGFLPRLTLRADFCAATALATEYPAQHAVLCEWGAKLSTMYSEVHPRLHIRQDALLGRVRREWVIPRSVFTQGIVNRNNVLRYHHDTGNFPDVWSVMVVLPNELEGGELVVPELGVAFGFRRPAVLMFDGSRLLHGVAPMRTLSSAGYRYSVVYYALKGMCHCLSPAEELVRIQRKKTSREVARAKKVP